MLLIPLNRALRARLFMLLGERHRKRQTVTVPTAKAAIGRSAKMLWRTQFDCARVAN
jgi:hypothetical protein